LIMVVYPILVADLGVLKWGPEPPPDAAQKRAVA
jgi:hypothetical protein